MKNRAKNDYLSSLTSNPTTKKAYNNFRKTGNVTFSTMPTNATLNLFADSKYSPNKTQTNLANTTLELFRTPGLSSTAEKALPKKLGHCIMPPLVAAKIVTNGHDRINASKQAGNDTLSSTLCGGLGAITQTTITVAGDAAVLNGVTAAMVETGGIAVLPAAFFAKNAFKLIDETAKSLGDGVQTACHSVYDHMKERTSTQSTPKLRKY